MALILPRRQLIVPGGYQKPVRPVLDPTHPINAGLIGCWLLGDGPHFFAEDLTGVSLGTPTSVTKVGSHHGGEAYSYTTSSQHSLASNPAWNFSGGPITLAGWVKQAFGAGGSLFSNINGTSRNWCLEDGNTDFSFLYGHSNFEQFRSSTTPTNIYDGNWHHLCATLIYATSTSAQLYYDGQPISGSWVSGTGTTTPDAASVGLIGGNNGSANAIAGQIEGCRIWKRYLSAAEVAQLYAEPYIGIFDQRPKVWSPVGGTVFTQTVAASSTPNATISRQTGKVVTQNTTPNATIVRLTGKIVTQNTTPNATIVRATSKVVTQNTTPNATIVRSTLKPVAASSTPNATIVRSTGKVVTQNTTPNATIVRQPNERMELSISTTPVATITTVFIPASTGGTLPPQRGPIIVGKLKHIPDSGP